MPVLIDHLERRLGRIDGGISVAGNSGDAPVSVARFRNGEIAKSVSYATIGLSNRPLRPRVPGKDLYMELIACEHEGPSGDDSLPRHLALIAQDLIDRNSALLRGDVFKFDTPLRPNSAMMGFYAALPVYFDLTWLTFQDHD